jgi:hypothetical protein
MPRRVRFTTHDACGRGEEPVPRVAHDVAEREAAVEPRGHLHTVHVVAHEDGAQLLEHQNEPIGHEHLLQVVTLVEIAEERPFEQVAEDRREHHARHQHQQELVAEQRRERERQVRADHVEAAVREVDHAHDPEDQREARRHEEEQQSVLNGVQALDEEGSEIHWLIPVGSKDEDPSPSVRLSVRPELVEGFRGLCPGFDRLSPNGGGGVVWNERLGRGARACAVYILQPRAGSARPLIAVLTSLFSLPSTLRR